MSEDRANRAPDAVHALQQRVAALEAELAQARDLLVQQRTFLMSGGLAVTWFSEDGTILLITEQGAKNLGGAPSDFVGRHIFDVLPAMREVARERFPIAFAGQVRYYETWVELPGGRRCFGSYYYPVRDSTSRIVAVQVVSQELTDLRTAEAALARSQATLEAAQARAMIGNWVVELPSGHTTWSRQMYRLLELDPAQDPPPTGRHLELVHPEDRGLLTQALADYAAHRSPAQIEFRTHPERGPIRHLSGAVERYEELGDGRIRIEGSMMDVTAHRRAVEERHQLQAQLEHAQKLESLGVLAGGIAHDFNNLIAAVLGNAELALHDVPPGGRAAEHLQEILGASQRAADLCSQMLAYSGRGQLVVRPVDVSAVVRDMTQLLDVAISKRAEFVSDLAEDLPAIRADVTQLRQIVMNLITNASEALGDADGTITVRTALRLVGDDRGEHAAGQPHVLLGVTDTGCGMDSATVSRMFDPFYSSKAPGRGLGLAAVQGIIRAHEGTIRVESAPGRGTAIEVLFPAVDEPPVEPSDGDATDTAARGSGTIMVVDDEAAVRTVVERSLETAGYLVFTACDGEEAVEFLREYGETVDLAVLDLSMPRLDGRQTLEQLRSIDPELRVVLISGYDQQSAMTGLISDARSTFLHKPFRARALLAKIAELLRGRS